VERQDELAGKCRDDIGRAAGDDRDARGWMDLRRRRVKRNHSIHRGLGQEHFRGNERGGVSRFPAVNEVAAEEEVGEAKGDGGERDERTEPEKRRESELQELSRARGESLKTCARVESGASSSVVER